MTDNDIMWASWCVEAKETKWAASGSCPILLLSWLAVVLLRVIFLSNHFSLTPLTLIWTDSKSQLPIQDTLRTVKEIRARKHTAHAKHSLYFLLFTLCFLYIGIILLDFQCNRDARYGTALLKDSDVKRNNAQGFVEYFLSLKIYISASLPVLINRKYTVISKW